MTQSDIRATEQQQTSESTTYATNDSDTIVPHDVNHFESKHSQPPTNDIHLQLAQLQNNQDRLHHAIQTFDTMEEELGDSDSDSDQGIRVNSNRSTILSISSLLSSDTNYDILLARLDSPKAHGNPAPALDKTTVTPASDEQQDDEIDWEFWSQVISNMNQTIKFKGFYHRIRQGIPGSLRGTIWPLLTKTKNTKNNSNNINGYLATGTIVDDQTYLNLMNKDSVFETAMGRDLDGLLLKHQVCHLKEPLFHLLKAYANYDGHVGYAKEFTALALPLVLHMPEEEALGVFIELLNGVYQWKSLYQSPMFGLSRMLFLLDGLVMHYLPELYQHLGTLAIHSTDYAKSWFTTLYVSCLPSLDLIYSIYDILLAEGTDILFGVGLALLKTNQDRLLALNEHDDLVQYLLGSQMMDAYKNDTKRIIQDAVDFRIQKRRLIRLTKEHHHIITSSRKRSISLFSPTEDMEALHMARQQNKALMEMIEQRQGNLKLLSKRHDLVTQQLVNAKLELSGVHQVNDKLLQQSLGLKTALGSLATETEGHLRARIGLLGGENTILADRNTELEHRLDEIETVLIDIKTKFAHSKNERDELENRLNEFRDLMDSCIVYSNTANTATL